MAGDWRGLYTIGTRRAGRMRGYMSTIARFHVPLCGRGRLPHLPHSPWSFSEGRRSAPSALHEVIGAMYLHTCYLADTPSPLPQFSTNQPTPPRRRIPDDAGGFAVPEIRCHQSPNEVANPE